MAKKKSTQKPLHNLVRQKMPKPIQWAHDFDYLDRLKPAERKWMNKFIGEYYNGEARKGDKNALHKTEEEKREAWGRKNRMHRDLLSRATVGKKLTKIVE